ncbi:hypothetical protein JX265_001895 [Neoarthrinium moseri]|uniref:Uncharacterized protein n=1 Tax=Neoarthrinium moseri TaxID=1658444 RepID=A0A9Q0AR40_9PEZI|nr:uncharacterized protein JN550_005647 [Neoarthrinium moseri]KAI1847889.1 hypothetical protein JX266_006002 [Neoarthrinium moseri]KAI1869666.1 hypothetical protein JN550_005647 [Neoarthrinium moseri]KAI1880274.1 hypothetical protein JX265_001895 [Neoarthrinium moseri]
MSPLFSKAIAFTLLSLFSIVVAQNDGYIGYQLSQRGDPDATLYETEGTIAGVRLPEEPDVYLNASVHVGLISVEVDNITAKVNLDAKVLNLLHFTAGVDASIDRVKLTIENVNAKVYLEARLGNVVAMVDDVLSSIDLNPIVATLGNVVGDVVGNVTDTLGGGSSSSSATSAAPSSTAAAQKRSLDALDYNMQHGILYSINNYAGDTHTNRVLGQNGTIWDVSLDNDGNEQGRRSVGSYNRDMTYTGHNRTTILNGVTEYELGYRYTPYVGLDIYAYIFMTPAGNVVKTKIVSEAEAGGTSTISDDAEQ